MIANRSRNLIIFIVILLISCQKGEKKPVFTTVMPTLPETKLDFSGFVTNDKFELVSQLYSFSRHYIEKDTINNIPVHIYISDNKRVPFYTDQDGTIWEYQTEDLSARLVIYGLITEAPVIFRYWRPLLKISAGKDSRWSVKIDTVFYTDDYDGKKHRIQYYHYGEAKYDGWSEAYVPERKEKPYEVMNAFWTDLQTHFYDYTTEDTIFVQKGIARQLFEPKLGAIRYLTDFKYKEHEGKYTLRKGTWELKYKYIPK